MMTILKGYSLDSTNKQTSGSKWQEILQFFPTDLRQILARFPVNIQNSAIEIRLRINQPLEINLDAKSVFIATDGRPVNEISQAVLISPEMIKKLLQSISAGSWYALEEESVQGYLTLPGGHRVGFTGHALQENGRIRFIRNIGSLNFRIAKTLKGIATPVMPLLWKEGRFLKTLIISPPAAGKTTLLREIIREVSYGNPRYNSAGIHVGLVDERSEIAGSYQGIPQLDVGPRTDLLDGASKKEGIYLLLRAMNPDLIATDEIGTDDDVRTIADVINAGVSFLATAHARNITEAILRPGLKRILENGSVERLITLSNRMGSGTIESIKAGISESELLAAAIRPGGTDD
ncbi:MAG TPA: stage III sporulation protein AA [Firmicutes bacterium]|jgi:stage III sporulation protein AA|nr:stage III sporulation protein AA [Bacillota bacterium]